MSSRLSHPRVIHAAEILNQRVIRTSYAKAALYFFIAVVLCVALYWIVLL